MKKRILVLLLICASFPAIAMEAPKLFDLLPAELTTQIIIAGVQQAKTPQEAVNQIKTQAQVNKLFRDIIKRDATFLIDYLAKKFNDPALSIALALGPELAQKWFETNEWFKKLSKIKYIRKVLIYLRDKKEIMAKHGAGIIDYLAKEFHSSPFRMAFKIGGLSEQWFRKKGLVKQSQELNEILLRKLKIEWKKLGEQFIEKAKHNKEQEIIDLLKKGVDLNFPGVLGNTALIWATIMGHRNIVQLLLEKGADPDIQGYDHETALQWASSKGHEDIVKQLLKKGANPDIESIIGTALMRASLDGHKNIIEILLQSGADPFITIQGETALDIAKKEGYTEIVKILQEAMKKR